LDEGKITEYILEVLVKAGYAENSDEVFGKLISAGIINRHGEINDNCIDKLISLLPEDSGLKVRNGVITGEGMPERPKVRLNLDNFNKIKDLWKTVTKRHLLKFEKLGKGEIEKLLKETFSNDGLFVEPKIAIKDEYLKSDGKTAVIETGGYRTVKSDIGVISYGEFLQRLYKQTSLPLTMLHKALSEARNGKNTPADLFNANTLQRIISAFEVKFAETYNQRFTYQPLEYTAQTSLFINGDFVKEIAQNYLGVNVAKEMKHDKERYLYDKVVYDSEIEYKVLKAEIPKQVTVYGKLPKMCIRLPTYTGGTTSPDFVFTVRGEKPEQVNIYLVVEAKSDNPRNSDKIALATQEKFFDLLKEENSDINIEWRMVTKVEDFSEELEKLIGDKT